MALPVRQFVRSRGWPLMVTDAISANALEAVASPKPVWTRTVPTSVAMVATAARSGFSALRRPPLIPIPMAWLTRTLPLRVDLLHRLLLTTDSIEGSARQPESPRVDPWAEDRKP